VIDTTTLHLLVTEEEDEDWFDNGAHVALVVCSVLGFLPAAAGIAYLAVKRPCLQNKTNTHAIR
jgi:hypothetical protein